MENRFKLTVKSLEKNIDKFNTYWQNNTNNSTKDKLQPIIFQIFKCEKFINDYIEHNEIVEYKERLKLLMLKLGIIKNKYNRSNLKPYFLIVAGPTGSGKGTLPEKVIQYLKLEKKYAPIIIDDLVEKNPYYKKKVKEYIEEHKDIEQKILNTNVDLIDTFNRFYFTGKDKTDCKSGSLKRIKINCSNLNDSNLKNALNNYKNVVIETKGTYWPDWLFTVKDFENIKNYDVIVAWSIVDICELLERNKHRALSSLKKFINDYENNPPRLPEIRADKYKKELELIINIFRQTNSHDKLCNNDKCIQLLLFDNNNTTNNVLYDSKLDKYDKGNNAIKQYNTDMDCMIDNLNDLRSIRDLKKTNKRSFFKRRSMKSPSMKSPSMKSRSMKSRPMKSRSMKSPSMKSRSMKSRSMKSFSKTMKSFAKTMKSILI